LARKILLADDSVTAQNMGRKILADAGYEVITVNNGSAALKKIAETKPDLIVLDVYMPGYSGLEVCQRLKEVKETARIPVLLTVGKLEPFKPEEARRVRAEGYIVKPFEASELLSALSKLEDRVVPRAESSKPGRFARAIAAVEEGRGDETGEVNDSADDGWKSRIGFPSKKKKKQPEQDESEIYNPGNRDLRTVVERPAVREMAPREEGRLDVAALAAAAGLPKDVTPEELAALAAAAAQVQAAVDGREPVAAPQQNDSEAASRAEGRSEAKIEAPAEITAEAKIETPTESKIESKSESQPEAQAVPQAAQPEAGEVATGATFAQQVADEAVAAPVNVTAKQSKPAAGVRDFDVIAAPAVQSDDANVQAAAGSGHGSGRTQAEADKKNAEEKQSEETAVPVTMAVAAGAGYVSVGSTTHRWTAVPVAIAAEEAAVSLELEMQKAYAAFAAAEANQPGFVPSPPATPVVENSISAAMVEAPAGPAPDEEEIARTLRDVANASVEAVDSALAKLEAVAEAQVQPGAAIAPGETHTEIVAAAARDLEAKRELEAREREAREVEARAQEAREREAKEAEAREQEAKEREAKEIEAREREARELEAREQAAREQEAKEREAKEIEAREREARELEAREQAAREQEAKEREAKEMEAREQAAREQAEAEAAAARAAAEAASAAALQDAGSAAESSVSEAAVAAVSEAPVQAKEKIAGGEMAEKRESDIAATTAAAWASWRQIRESGDKSKTGPAKANQQDDDDEEYPELPPDRAAMAAAAGAEKTPSAEEAPEAADDPEAIANIVDKVLADLRPKIAEEISKKLKKK
jgi:CheY-like chemotaxis protein